MKKGIFYSVGIGNTAGDITLKAKKTIENSDVIIAPIRKSGSKSRAYSLAKQSCNISGKTVLEVIFPMTHGVDYRKIINSQKIGQIEYLLNIGKDVAMITLGDASIYSTCIYLREFLKDKGYETKTIAGVPSFCECAAESEVALCERNQDLVCLSGFDSEKIENAVKSGNNVIIMKAFRHIQDIIQLLLKYDLLENTIQFTDIGHESEYIGKPDQKKATYLTTILITVKGME